MAGRRTKPQINRRRFHSARVAEAATPKERLWALCHWLVAESFQSGRLNETIEIVETHLAELIKARELAESRKKVAG